MFIFSIGASLNQAFDPQAEGSHKKIQCCGSGMFIPDPEFSHPGSRFSDPKTATKDRGENFFLSFLFMKPQISHN
jgi:hypothetical protein